MIEVKTEKDQIIVNIELNKRAYAREEVVSFSNSSVVTALEDLGHNMQNYSLVKEGYASNRSEDTLTSSWIFTKNNLPKNVISDKLSNTKEKINATKSRSNTNNRTSRKSKNTKN